uniref:Uncharacterized protein n=1 Tax=Timema monikensis TaxID=170555 RepID=A0A7R9E8T1_9NEOP|nr:unnamed protein product [Timema monikensis]
MKLAQPLDLLIQKMEEIQRLLCASQQQEPEQNDSHEEVSLPPGHTPVQRPLRQRLIHRDQLQIIQRQSTFTASINKTSCEPQEEQQQQKDLIAQGGEVSELNAEQFEVDYKAPMLWCEELTDDNDVWLVQCPNTIEPECLVNQQFSLSGVTELPINPGQQLQVSSFHRHSEPLTCVLPSNKNLSFTTGLSPDRVCPASPASLPYNAKPRCSSECTDWPGVRAKTSPLPERPHVQATVVVEPAGLLLVKEQVQIPPTIIPSGQKGPVPFPKQLKIRHPLFGSEYINELQHAASLHNSVKGTLRIQGEHIGKDNHSMTERRGKKRKRDSKNEILDYLNQDAVHSEPSTVLHLDNNASRIPSACLVSCDQQPDWFRLFVMWPVPSRRFSCVEPAANSNGVATDMITTKYRGNTLNGELMPTSSPTTRGTIGTIVPGLGHSLVGGSKVKPSGSKTCQFKRMTSAMWDSFHCEHYALWLMTRRTDRAVWLSFLRQPLAVAPDAHWVYSHVLQMGHSTTHLTDTGSIDGDLHRQLPTDFWGHFFALSGPASLERAGFANP